ncbi:MAG TPA: nucleoside triphosphate pyrophosphatase [Micromonosporaceae bacterium]|nr:nucleoside triphosphate pyrophosphatase [Micromonosporaceae bacterium]
MNPRLVLASASPARRRLLAAAGIDADAVVSGVDESTVEATRPEVLCVVLARMKAEAVAHRLRVDGAARAGDRLLVLGCDSVLHFDGEILGKPADADEATRRWRAMRGGKGVLHTGHCLIDMAAGRRIDGAAATTVHFANVDDAEIEAYVADGEPLAVAGAFTIDGLGAPFIAGIEGDHGNVIGLSLPLLRTMLAELGVRITDLWRGAGTVAGPRTTAAGPGSTA